MHKLLAKTAILIAAVSMPAIAATTPEDVAAAEAFQDRYLEKVHQVADASWPLLVHGADLCQLDTAYRTGIRYAVLNEEMLTSGPRVTAVPTGSPAHTAGVQRGDLLVTVNGKKVQKRSEDATAKNLDELFAETTGSDDPIALTVECDGQTLEITMNPVIVCDLQVEYVPVATQFHARNGVVAVSDLLFLVTQHDWQRRAFIAPDMAYAMNPTQKVNDRKKRLLGIGGNVLAALAGVDGIATVANLGGSLVMNKGQALDADRISLFLLARAGDDLDHVVAFWPSVYEYPEGDSWKSTYFGLRPTLAERTATFQSAIEEINSLKDAGHPLIPGKRQSRG